MTGGSDLSEGMSAHADTPTGSPNLEALPGGGNELAQVKSLVVPLGPIFSVRTCNWSLVVHLKGAAEDGLKKQSWFAIYQRLDAVGNV